MRKRQCGGSTHGYALPVIQLNPSTPRSVFYELKFRWIDDFLLLSKLQEIAVFTQNIDCLSFAK
jgi:hypothetical protein